MVLRIFFAHSFKCLQKDTPALTPMLSLFVFHLSSYFPPPLHMLCVSSSLRPGEDAEGLGASQFA